MNMNVSGEIIKKLRVERGWTQEHLAHLASVSARTIQRVEKTGICDLETRSALASVFQIEVTQLDGEKKIEQTRSTQDTDPLYYSRITSGNGIVDVFSGAHGYRFSHEDPRSGDDAEYIAELVSQINDYSECWDDISAGGRVRATFEFGEMLKEMLERGFWLFGLRTRSKMKLPSRDGNETPFELNIANFHFAYSDSEQIIVLDAKKRGQSG